MRRSATLLAGALLGLAGSAHAQGAAQGWIGISYGLRAEEDGSRTAVVTQVVRGSPADRAGIQAGDRLIAIDGIVGVDELRDLLRRLNLRAGQEVSVQLERGSRPMGLRLRAAERPAAAVRVSSSATSDSVVEVTLRAMDSLRVRILRERGPRREVSRTGGRPADPTPSAREPTAAWFDIETRMGPRGVRTPFEFFVFQGESHDSLLREMQELERGLARLRREQGARLEELRRSSRSRREAEQDLELRDVREAIEALTSRSDQLAAAMSEAARATAGVEYVLRGPEPAGFRPLTPYLVGSNRVAGAEVVAIGPELGAYFGVSDGVLVVDVAPGTPAAIADMRPGDVVTRLDQAAVRSVEDLRFRVTQARDTLPITLVRRGSSLEVLLLRR